MSFHKKTWIGLKVLLSTILVAFGVGLFIYLVASGNFLDPALYGLIGLLLFLAAMPWMARFSPLLILGLCSLFCGFISLIGFWATVIGEIQYPRTCIGRRGFGCDLMNEVYSIGGIGAVSFVLAAMGAVFLFGGVRFLALLKKEQS